jgi:aminoglycoside phosphotransferase (APT) family kinase protein
MADLLDRPAPVRSGEELNASALEAYLQRNFPEASGPLAIRQYPSGHSNLTYAIQFGREDLVLRRPPFGSKVKTAHDMGREFRVLSKLHAVYAPAPEVVAFCDDESILGAPFYLMRPIHGVILRKNLPPAITVSPAQALQMNRALIDNLIRLHRVDYLSAGLADLGKPEGYLARQVRGWIERYHHSKTHEYLEIEALTAYFQQDMPATQSIALVHNDYKFDNVVLAAEDLTKIIGVLDWEMCTIGDPLTDLGTTLAYWVDPTDAEELKQNLSDVTLQPGSLTRRQVVAHYAQQTGSDVSRISYYLAFARFKLAVIVQQIFYRFHQGLTKDPRFAALPERVSALLRASLHAASTNQI